MGSKTLNAHLNIVPLRALRDNYVWTLTSETDAVPVDPGDAQPVLDYLAASGKRLTAILITHHHADHTDGVAELVRKHPGISVYGPKISVGRIPEITHPVNDGDSIELPEIGATFAVIGIPGHTLDHTAYYGGNALFCGDTLFGCGCGRLFEGTPEQMFASLNRLAALPDETLIYCGHEYTLANIDFAKRVEPNNAALTRRADEDAERVKVTGSSLPSTLGREKATNPFLRCLEPAVIASVDKHLGSRAVAGSSDPVRVFAALREWKNQS
jgi:hydroxyacylglutathione hydrolase